MRKLSAAFFTILSSFLLPVYAADSPPANPFTLNTTAFLDQGALPVLYTCDGKDVSPELDWTGAPAKTQTFAFLFTDPEAPNGTFYHWVLYNIPKTMTTLPEGQNKAPASALAGKNSWGKLQYNGPCPPKGTAHTYALTLYALDTPLTLPSGADGKAITAAMQKHIVGKVELTTVYSRWIK